MSGVLSAPFSFPVRGLIAAVFVAALGTSAADARPPDREVPQGSVKIAKLLQECGKGFVKASTTLKSYRCILKTHPKCRGKYTRTHDPYIIGSKNPPWFVYICQKKKPGPTKPTRKDCAMGFSKVGEVPKSHYRCYREFNPTCSAGYTSLAPKIGASKTAVWLSYGCRRV